MSGSAGATSGGGVSASSGVNNEGTASQVSGTSWISGPQKSEMKQNCSDYLTSYGLASSADFGNLDDNTAKDIAVAIQETKEMFPELDLRFVGSLQSRNEGIKQGLTDMYMQVFKQYNPGVPDDELIEEVQKRVAEDLEGLQPSGGTIAQSLFVPEPSGFSDSVIGSFNGITINEGFGSDYEYFKSVRRSDVDSGYKPQNCYSPKATVDHELGHQIAKLVDAHNDEFIQEKYKEFYSLDDSGKAAELSGYAGTSIHEFLAESWSEYRNNPQCRNLAREISERMIDLYNQSKLVKVRVR